MEPLNKLPVIPCGMARTRRTAPINRLTSPNTGVVRNVVPVSSVPNNVDAEQRTGHRGAAAADDGDEGLGDILHAHRRQHARQRRDHPAGKPRERGSNREGNGVDVGGIDAERTHHLRVLHGGAGNDAKRREAQRSPQRGSRHDRHAHEREIVVAEFIASEGHRAERRRDAAGGVAEYHRHGADHRQAQPPRCQHGVDHPAVEETNNGAFDEETERTDDQRRKHQRGKPQIDPGIDRGDHGVAAEHDEFAMGEIDHPHHAENHRQPDRDEDQAGD